MAQQLSPEQRRLVKTGIFHVTFNLVGNFGDAEIFTASEYARQLVSSPFWVEQQHDAEAAVFQAMDRAVDAHLKIADRFHLPDTPRRDIGRLLFVFAELKCDRDFESMGVERRLKELLPRIRRTASQWEDSPSAELLTWCLKWIWHLAEPLWSAPDLEVN